MKKRFFTRLSALQIKGLCALASQAFKAAKARGAVPDDMTADEWRREGQMEAAGVASLKLATQEHYLAIKGKWFTVLGNLEEAFYCFLNASAEHEATRQMRWRLMGQVALLADGIQHRHFIETSVRLADDESARQAWAYTKSLARDKGGKSLESLDADALEQLGFTVVNRANAKRGKGDSMKRNKSQRRAARRPDDVSQLGASESAGPDAPEGRSMVARLAEKLAARQAAPL